MPGGWALFAAGNRQGDRGVTYAMPAPLANRFTHYHLERGLRALGEVQRQREEQRREVGR